MAAARVRVAPMSAARAGVDAGPMPRFVLEHAHTPRECGVVFASFKGFESPLRHGTAVGACAFGTHRIWWDVEAATADEALGRLPRYVAVAHDGDPRRRAPDALTRPLGAGVRGRVAVRGFPRCPGRAVPARGPGSRSPTAPPEDTPWHR